MPNLGYISVADAQNLPIPQHQTVAGTASEATQGELNADFVLPGISPNVPALSIVRFAALGATPQLVKGSVGRLGFWTFPNPDSGQTLWALFYDSATAAGIAPGTTAPLLELMIFEGGSEVTPAPDFPIKFSSGLVVAVVSDPTTGAAPAVSLRCAVGIA